MTARRRGAAWWLFWAAVAGLAVLHQDFWNWDDTRLVLGFLPVGLLYHALYSLAAVTLWFVSIRVVWPHHIEEWAEEGVAEDGT